MDGHGGQLPPDARRVSEKIARIHQDVRVEWLQASTPDVGAAATDFLPILRVALLAGHLLLSTLSAST